MTEPEVTVLGAGLWGTVLANHLAEKSCRVLLWEYFAELAEKLQRGRTHPHLPGLKLDDHIQATPDLKQAVEKALLILVALPSQHVRDVARQMRSHIGRRKPRPLLVNASKGLEPQTLKTMCEVIEEELPTLRGRVFALSGPSFAREVAREIPTLLMLAGPKNGFVRNIKKILEGHPLQIETTTDRKGVELGGSLKNVLAIGCGILDGLRTGANTKALLITRGIQEISLLIQRMGGKPSTIYGPSGLGDLIATGTSSESRNRALGEKLGQGKSLEAARKEVLTVAEGVESTLSAFRLCRRLKLRAPILTAIWKIVHQNQSPRALVEALGFYG